jgi:hypothetical protein
MWISWKHEDSALSEPLSFEQKVDLFCEQALGWQLHVADLVANGGTAFGENGDRNGNTVSAIRHSGFAVLQICLSYFETIGYYTGESSGSGAAFRKGVAEVFPDFAREHPDKAKAFANALYKDARCGLYHNVRTARVGLGTPPDGAPIAYVSQRRLVVVSPERFPKALKAHLEFFRNALLDHDNQELRKVFADRFDDDHGAKR